MHGEKSQAEITCWNAAGLASQHKSPTFWAVRDTPKIESGSISLIPTVSRATRLNRVANASQLIITWVGFRFRDDVPINGYDIQLRQGGKLLLSSREVRKEAIILLPKTAEAIRPLLPVKVGIKAFSHETLLSPPLSASFVVDPTPPTVSQHPVHIEFDKGHCSIDVTSLFREDDVQPPAGLQYSLRIGKARWAREMVHQTFTTEVLQCTASYLPGFTYFFSLGATNRAGIEAGVTLTLMLPSSFDSSGVFELTRN